MKVCVIDDNESITKMLTTYLKLKGHEAMIVNSGREGLAVLEKEDFDTVVLDLAMPEFSGQDILESLTKSGRIKDHKICVFTASSISESEIEELKTKGAIHILKKPVDLPALIPTLEKIVNSG